jgi:two-component system sensor histidine kinase BaeS
VVRAWRRFCTRSLVWQLTHAQVSVVCALGVTAIVGLALVQSQSSYVSALTAGLSGDAQLAVRVVAGVLPILVVVSGLAALALPLVLPPAFLLAWLAARGTARHVERLVAVEAMANARRELFARVAHELKNPLAVLRIAVDGLRARGPRLPEIDVLDDGVRGLTHVVGDLTELARAEVPDLRLVLEYVDLARSIDAVVRAHVTAASERDIVLMADTGALHGTRRYVDRQRLEQVLANLIQNALRHVDPGGVVRVSGTLEHGRALIRVEDTGRGIEPELLEHVFEPGFSRDGGLGLGLALARELMLRMHGEIRVESQPGRGACFTLVV